MQQGRIIENYPYHWLWIVRKKYCYPVISMFCYSLFPQNVLYYKKEILGVTCGAVSITKGMF